MLYIRRFKEIQGKFGPKWCWVNTNWYANVLFENHVTNRVTNHSFTRKDKALTSLCLVKYVLPTALEVQWIDILEKPMCCLTLDLKTKLITSESTFMRSLSRVVVQKVLHAKVETDFFLTLILFSIVAIGKEFCTTQNFLQPK